MDFTGSVLHKHENCDVSKVSQELQNQEIIEDWRNKLKGRVFNQKIEALIDSMCSFLTNPNFSKKCPDDDATNLGEDQEPRRENEEQALKLIKNYLTVDNDFFSEYLLHYSPPFMDELDEKPITTYLSKINDDLSLSENKLEHLLELINSPLVQKGGNNNTMEPAFTGANMAGDIGKKLLANSPQVKAAILANKVVPTGALTSALTGAAGAANLTGAAGAATNLTDAGALTGAADAALLTDVKPSALTGALTGALTADAADAALADAALAASDPTAAALAASAPTAAAAAAPTAAGAAGAAPAGFFSSLRSGAAAGLGAGLGAAKEFVVNTDVHKKKPGIDLDIVSQLNTNKAERVLDAYVDIGAQTIKCNKEVQKYIVDKLIVGLYTDVDKILKSKPQNEPLKEMLQQLSITTTTKCYESRLEHLNNHILCMMTLLDKINPSNDENEVNNDELEKHTYNFLDLLLEKYLINAKIKMIQEINIQDANKKDMQNVYTYIKSNDLLQNKIKTIFSDKDNKMFQVKNVEKLEDLNYGNTQGTERVIIDKNLLNSTYFNNFKYDLLINVFSTNDNNLEKEITKKLKEIENQRKGNETKGGSRKKKINRLRTKKQIYKSAKNTRRRRR